MGSPETGSECSFFESVKQMLNSKDAELNGVVEKLWHLSEVIAGLMHEDEEVVCAVIRDELAVLDAGRFEGEVYFGLLKQLLAKGVSLGFLDEFRTFLSEIRKLINGQNKFAKLTYALNRVERALRGELSEVLPAEPAAAIGVPGLAQLQRVAASVFMGIASALPFEFANDGINVDSARVASQAAISQVVE